MNNGLVMSLEKVLVVDDHKIVHQILRKSLDEVCEIRGAFDGDEGIQMAADWHPDVILLDVEMPGKNGYEVCDTLKQADSTGDIPIVFLSAHSSLRERMLGYEVGGDDYLVKPFEVEELNAKLVRLAQHAVEKRALKESVGSAQQTAMEAMTSCFELGKSVRFVEQSYMAASHDELGKMFMRFCTELELSAVALFRTRDELLFYSSTGSTVSCLECEILEMLHDKERFVDFGCRTQVNYPHVSLLVKNMPLNERARYGRIKDTLPFVLEVCDAKIRVMDAELVLRAQSGKLSVSAEAVRATLNTVQQSFQENIKVVSELMSGLLAELSMDMTRLGLEHDQEQAICDKVEAASKAVFASVEKSAGLESTLGAVISLLEKLIDEQNDILAPIHEPPEDDSGVVDVELF